MTKRGSFGPVVLLGLGAATLAAVAANRAWTETYRPGGSAEGSDGQILEFPPIDYDALAKDAPLAGALALVALAAWGVLLVTRGRVRRVFAVVAATAAAGLVVATVDAYSSLKDAVFADLAEAGLTGEALERSRASIYMNDWWPTALAAGILLLLASLLAVWLAPSWPEMGSRYDAPSDAAGAAGGGVDELSNIDIWKSLDAGRDPTLDPKGPEEPGS